MLEVMQVVKIDFQMVKSSQLEGVVQSMKLLETKNKNLTKTVSKKKKYHYNGLMVSALMRMSGPGSSPCQGHCAVFLGKTLYSHSVSLHPGVQLGTRQSMLRVTLQ